MNLDGKKVVPVPEVEVGNTNTSTSGTNGRYWMFTINNYCETDLTLMEAWAKQALNICVTKEVGDQGTPHLQGYIGFKGKKRLSALKKMHSRAHWELSRSKDAAMYSLKEHSEVVVNENKKTQGRRTDLHNLVDAVEKGADIKTLWNEHKVAMIKYHKGVEEGMRHWKSRKVEIRFDISKFCREKLDLSLPVILWGNPGIGKTSYAKAHFQNPLLVSHMDDLINLTVDHDGIIFDDMSFKHMPRSAQIHLVDSDEDRSIHCRYRCAVIPAYTKKIFCTNEMDGMIFDLMDGAISRRVVVENVNKLF